MKPFQLSDPATAELTHAIRWYEQQRTGLGGELLDAITETIDLIRHIPRSACLDPRDDPAGSSM